MELMHNICSYFSVIMTTAPTGNIQTVLIRMFIQLLLHQLDDIVVIGAGQTFICCQDHITVVFITIRFFPSQINM